MWPIEKENAGHELSGHISRGLEIVGDKRKEREKGKMDFCPKLREPWQNLIGTSVLRS